MDIFNLAYFWLIIPAVLIFWGIVTYNRFVSFRRIAHEAWSGIAVQLKRRHDIIPNLVGTVKGYMTHEQATFENIARLRSAAMQELKTGASPKDLSLHENALSGAIGKLLLNVENYPELRASQNFISLQGMLQEVEETLQMARRYHNGTVRNYIILLESFPSLLIGKIFGFHPEAFFELDNPAEEKNPEVKF